MEIKELKRQLMHILFGCILLIGIVTNIFSNVTIFLFLIITILLSLISKLVKVPIFSKFIEKFEREKVVNTLPGKGMIFFLFGSLLSLQLFEKDIALAAITILTFGDSVSHIIGSQYGKLRNIFNSKSPKLFEGTLSGIVVGFLSALLFVNPTEALLASFVGMSAEAVDLKLNTKALDDNLLIPLAAGTTIFLLRKFLLI